MYEAIVKINGRYPKPFVIEVIPYKYEKTVTNYELKNHMQPIIDDLTRKTTPRTTYAQVLENKRKEAEARRKQEAQHEAAYSEPKEKTEGNIFIRILNNIIDEPFIDQKERIEKLNLSSSSSTNSRYFKELVEEKLAEPRRLGFGKSLGSRLFYELTPKGARYIRKDCFMAGQESSFEHRFWEHTIANYFKAIGHDEVEAEKRYGNKNVDVGLTLNGKKTAIEIELSPKHLQENIQKDFEAGCEFVIIAVKSIGSAKFYKKKVQKIFGDELLKKIDFRILAHFLS
jgi:DNA-binding MarR family transcriptional regulator